MSDLRHVPASFAPEVVAEIDRRLDETCTAHGVFIPLAIESGSRAWGFPSPDSDYDCRFVYVRRLEQHLSPWPSRDVIETPLDQVFDVNGWDLGKALKLLLRGNAVIIEWLRSPITYRGHAWFREEMLAFSGRFADRDLIARHYLHLGERQRRVYFADEQAVAQKKIFYALRPAATLRWLRLHPDAAIAPMNFPALLNECDPPGVVAELCEGLLRRKAISHELGTEPLPPAIARFIDEEFALARGVFERPAEPPPAEAREEAERLYRRVIQRLEAESATPALDASLPPA
jgi:predicted nucleotidyltransferase